MSTTAIDTAGTTDGIIAEVERRFSRKDQLEAAGAIEEGLDIPLDGLHTDGWYDGQRVRMCRSTSLSVTTATSRKQRQLWRVAWGPDYIKKVRKGKKSILPEGGDHLVRIETALATIKGWTGEMENRASEMVDLSVLDAEGVRSFIRSERLPEWKIASDQTGNLPKYEPAKVDIEFLDMLEEANELLDTEIDFLALRSHLKTNGTSKNPFVVMHDGIFDPEELLTPTK